MGDFCEYQCPVANQLKCSGNGICSAGKCYCTGNYSDLDCSCDEGTSNCRLGLSSKYADNSCNLNWETFYFKGLFKLSLIALIKLKYKF